MKVGTIVIILLIVAAVAGLFIVGNLKMDADDITYDGQTVKWDAPIMSDHFEIQIDDGAVKEVTVEEYNYKPTAANFKVKITVYKSLDFLFKPHTVEKEFIGLDVAENLKYEDGVLTWDEVEGAVKYEVEVTKGNSSTTEEVAGASFDYAEAGDVTFRVKPVGSSASHYALWSEALSVHILETPTNVAYNNVSYKITWTANARASSYTVFVNGEEVQGSPTAENWVSYIPDNILEGTTFEIKVRANGDGVSRFDSALSEGVQYGYLKSIDASELAITAGVLTWPAIDNAEGYYVRIGANSQYSTVTTNSYADIIPGNNNDIQVMPFNNSGNYFSTWSEEVSYYVPTAPNPTVSTYTTDETLIAWADSVIGAGYLGELKKDGQVILSADQLTFVAGTGGKNEYKNAFADAGVYEFRLLAVNDGVQSKWSDPVVITRLSAPETHTVSDSETTLNSSTTVSFSPVKDAKSYYISYNCADSADVEYLPNLNDTKFTFGELRDSNNAVINGKTITINVFANSYKENGKSLYLASKTPHQITVTKLAVPQNFRISENLAKWDSVQDAQGYIISVSNTANKELVIQTVGAGVTQTSLNITEAGTYSVTVRARGNGSNVISSDNNGEPCTVTRLATPTGLRIVNGVLMWNAVGKAQGYTVKVGENEVARNIGTTEYNLRSVSATTAQSVVVYAVGKHGDATETTLDSLSTQPLSFQKLTTPTGVTVDNSNISITKVDNATAYKVYINSDLVATVTNTSLPHASYIKNAGDYQVKVVAVGNTTTSVSSGTAYLDSDETAAVNVSKLASPTLYVNDGDGKLYWNTDVNFTEVSVVFGTNSTKLPANSASYEIPKISTVGDYNIRVAFVGNGSASLQSAGTITSAESSLDFVVTQLTKPTISAELSSDNTQLTVKVTNSADYYYLSEWLFNQGSDVAGSHTFTEGEEIKYTFDVTTTANYKVAAKGDFFVNEGGAVKYVIGSEYSAEKKLVKLEAAYNIERAQGSSADTKKFTVVHSNSTAGVTLQYTFEVACPGSDPVTYGPQTSNTIEIDYVQDTVIKVTISATSTNPDTLILPSDVYTYTVN